MARLLFNEHARERVTSHQPTRAPLHFHQRLPGYRPTPLRSLPELAGQLGVGELLVKDESSRLGLPAFKILGASWATYQACAERLGENLQHWSTLRELRQHMDWLQPLQLVTATDGNHGRGVARVALLFGFQAHVFVPEDTAQARIAGIESEHAEVTIIAGSYDETVRQAAAYAHGPNRLLIQDTAWPGYEQIPAWVIEGYSTLFHEIDDQLAAMSAQAPAHESEESAAQQNNPDAVVVPIGVGSLAAAAIAHYKHTDATHPPRIIGIEPSAAACALETAVADELVTVPGPHRSMMAGLNCGTLASLAWPLLRTGIDCYLAINDELVPTAMRLLAAAGITAGESGAATLAATLDVLGSDHAARFRDELGLNVDSRVLLLMTEGATDPVHYARIVGNADHTGDSRRTTP